MQTFIDKYIHQGFESGIVQGQIQLLLKMMEGRFGALPQQVREKIESADFQSIEKWSLRLFSATGPEEVVSLN